jgi:LysR family transcriptional regulator, glycine cleavage system transcriptional activator
MLHKVSLPGIRIFETVARRGSHKAAAAELNLSPSAVSHAIKNLEQVMGVHLFEKEGRSVRLTVSGEVFMQYVVTAFDELRRGFETVVAGKGTRVLRLHSAPSIAYAWLTPRLPQFLADNPGIEVRLSAGTDYSRFNADDFDADIVYGPIHARNVIAVPLGEETVTPLCSPEMAERIRTPVDLLACNLILSDNKQVRWLHWLRANGITDNTHHNLRFDRSFLALGVAADGLGVALESTLLAKRDIDNGRLVAPLLGQSKDITYVGHHLVYPRETRHGNLLNVFKLWLIQNMQERNKSMI